MAMVNCTNLKQSNSILVLRRTGDPVRLQLQQAVIMLFFFYVTFQRDISLPFSFASDFKFTTKESIVSKSCGESLRRCLTTSQLTLVPAEFLIEPLSVQRPRTYFLKLSVPDRS